MENRILLVDDEPEFFSVVARRLRERGYFVDLAINAADAWRCLGGQRYAVVIADWQLPDGDGIQIADAAADHGAKTVVISGYALDTQRLGRHVTLAKPVSIRDLVTLVEQSIA